MGWGSEHVAHNGSLEIRSKPCHLLLVKPVNIAHINPAVSGLGSRGPVNLNRINRWRVCNRQDALSV